MVVSRQSRWAAIAAVAAAGIILHASLSGVLAGNDFLKYPLAADQFLRGELPSERLRDFSPLYLGLHIAAQRLLPEPVLVVQIMQDALCIASAVLLLLLLETLVPAALAIAGTVAFLLNSSVIIYTHVLEPEILLVFFLLGVAYFAGREGRGGTLLSGIFCGLAAITRPSFLPLVFLLPVWFLVRGDRGARWLTRSALFVTPSVLAVIAVAAISAGRQGEAPSAVIMSPGTVFFEGNNPLSMGFGVYPPLVSDLGFEISDQIDYQHAVYRLLARRATGREMTQGETNRFWAGKAVAFMRDEPAHAMRLFAAKAWYFLHDYRKHDINGAYLMDRRLSAVGWLPAIPFALVSALALAGFAILTPRWKQTLPCFLIWANQFGVSVLMYVSDRQRVAVLPFFIIFAAAALGWSLKSRKNGVVLVLAVIPLSVFLRVKSDVLREDEHLYGVYAASEELQGKASRLLAQRDASGAASAAAAALAATPWMSDWIRPPGLFFGPGGMAQSALAHAPAVSAEDFSGRLDRVILLIEAGESGQADTLLRALVGEGRHFARGLDGPSSPEFYLGINAASRGDRPEARKFLEAALSAAPGDPFVLAWLAAVSGEATYRERLSRYFDEADAAFLLGQAYLKLGDAGAAVACFSRVAELAPEYRRGQIYLAAAQGADGQFGRAAKTYLDAVQAKPGPVMLEPEILRVFAGLVAAYPDNAEALASERFVRCQFAACPP